MYQQFYQPNNFGNYQQMQQQQQYQSPVATYQERLAQMQQQYMPQVQQTQQLNYLPGKIVDSIDVVKATDVPMDGSFHYFPKADGSEIYAKRWLANGKTEVIAYSPVISNEEQSTNTLEDQFKVLHTDVVNGFNTIDERIGKLESLMVQKPNVRNNNNGKKEDGTNV